MVRSVLRSNHRCGGPFDNMQKRIQTCPARHNGGHFQHLLESQILSVYFFDH